MNDAGSLLPAGRELESRVDLGKQPVMDWLQGVPEEGTERQRDSKKEKIRNLLGHSRSVILVYDYRGDEKCRPFQEAARVLAFLCFVYF